MKKAGPSNNYHYNKALKQHARFNRHNMPKSAACLWKYVLSRRQMLGLQFRRERPILNYIADFVCLEILLIVEVDGFSHTNLESIIRDRTRDHALARAGFTTLRFSSAQVLEHIEIVRSDIESWILKNIYN